jgi:hypothetical protein
MQTQVYSPWRLPHKGPKNVESFNKRPATVRSSMHFDDTFCATRFTRPCEMPRQDRAYSKTCQSTTSVFLSNMQQVSVFVTSHHQAQIKIQTKKTILTFTHTARLRNLIICCVYAFSLHILYRAGWQFISKPKHVAYYAINTVLIHLYLVVSFTSLLYHYGLSPEDSDN